ncbi:MAG: HsdM family class I SAM-dependent methyltransferase [Mycoplasma sp.]
MFKITIIEKSQKMKSKTLGQVFTPKHIVKEMLKTINYTIDQDLSKLKIIDNSCGDGAFLQEIVLTLIEKYKTEAKQYIENNVFGIELDKEAYDNCISNLNKITTNNGIKIDKWNIINDNTLKVYEEHKNQFDIVIGNPPYIRIHNTNKEFKNLDFCQFGMSDLYIAFYQIGIEILNKNGKLCFINPSSIFNSKASLFLRNYLIDNKLITKVIDFKHQQFFDKITTYSCVVVLDKNNNKEIIDFSTSFDNFIKIEYFDFNIFSNFYFSKDISQLKKLKDILTTPIQKNIWG